MDFDFSIFTIILLSKSIDYIAYHNCYLFALNKTYSYIYIVLFSNLQPPPLVSLIDVS